MNIILLSGGSGKRLWPLSNDVRSKQFIKLFKNNDEYESMVQRVYRQVTTVDADAKITIATSKSQASAIKNQLGEKASICVEPCRRDTFPAIALAAAYLHDELGVAEDEAVVVCPVDPYVDNTYYDAYYDERYLWEADKVLNDDREMILVGNIVQKSMLKKYSSKKQLKAIGYHQIMKNCPSPVLVFPYTLYCKGICFDENFGVGATFGACEETDLILEALDNKYQIGYCENMFVVHPTMQHSFEIENTTEVKKRENYARGLGALLEKDKVIRKNKRLHYYEMEKKCKILLKKTGLFGKKEKDLAIADLRGLNTGKRDFRKLLEKETYR